MKIGVEYTGVVTKIAFPNKGEVDCGEDGIASVKGTLPGQKVKFVVSKKRSGKAQGRLKEIIEKSPMEDVEPNCPHFGDCGGCSYQTMSYENQLKLKEDMVKGILDNAIKETTGLREYLAVLCSGATEIRCNFLLVTSLRMDLWHLECTRKTVSTTL